VSLYLRVDFADALEAMVYGPVYSVGGGFTGGGIQGGEGDEAVGMLANGGKVPLVLFCAGVVVLPVPAEEDGFIDAGGIHVLQEGVDVSPALNGGFAEGGDTICPVGFVSAECPLYWVLKDRLRVVVSVGVDDGHWGEWRVGSWEFRWRGGGGRCRVRL